MQIEALTTLKKSTGRQLHTAKPSPCFTALSEERGFHFFASSEMTVLKKVYTVFSPVDNYHPQCYNTSITKSERTVIMTLKELREKEKISQAKLAKALGVSSTLISAIETGVKPASNAVIDKVKEVYGVAIEKVVVAEAAVKAEAAKAEAEAEKQVKETKAKAKAAGEKAKEVVKKTKATVKAEAAKVIKKAPGSVTIQSPLGGEITTAEILARIPAGADKVYIRVDQNKAYWVKGDETGSVDLW